MKTTMENFAKMVEENVMTLMPLSVENVSVKYVTKNNGKRYCGLIIKDKNSNMTPLIYLEKYHDDFENCVPFYEVLNNIVSDYIKIDKQKFDLNIDISNFDNVKNKIFPKMVNAENNTEFLKDKPHTIIADLAVTYYVKVKETDSGNAVIHITDNMMEMYGITEKDLHDIAFSNMNKYEPMVISGMTETLFGVANPNEFIYIITNENMLNGAVCIADKGNLDMVCRKLGYDCIILPSSIHEVLIVKGNDIATDDLFAMVKEINANEVLPEEKLSDNVYKYDVATGLFKITR